MTNSDTRSNRWMEQLVQEELPFSVRRREVFSTTWLSCPQLRCESFSYDSTRCFLDQGFLLSFPVAFPFEPPALLHTWGHKNKCVALEKKFDELIACWSTHCGIMMRGVLIQLIAELEEGSILELTGLLSSSMSSEDKREP